MSAELSLYVQLTEKYSDKTEVELWKEFKNTADPNIRQYLILKYAPLVKYVAGKVVVSMPNNVEFDDLVSYGTFGLLDAIEKFDPFKEVQFKTYAITRIRGSIFDELRTIDWIPRSIRQKAKEIEKTIFELENKLGRTIEDEEVAKEMGISLQEFHTLLSKVSGTSLSSLNDVWHGNNNSNSGGGEESFFIEILESPENLNPDNIIERQEIKKMIIESIQKLPDKEKKVVILYYYEDLTLKEIGEVLEVTESRVSQLHTKAIMRLRGKLSQIKNVIYN